MLSHIEKLKYYRHFRIINYIGLKLFIFIINLNVIQSSNIFSTLVYVFRCNVFCYELMKFISF